MGEWAKSEPPNTAEVFEMPGCAEKGSRGVLGLGENLMRDSGGVEGAECVFLWVPRSR